jgi:hypothetical protein
MPNENNVESSIKNKLINVYGTIEQRIINPLQKILLLREIATIRKNFDNGAASTAILYGYPLYHGNIQNEGSEERQNKMYYLDSIRQINLQLRIGKLALSGFITEHKDESGNYINQNPITEAEAAKDYYRSFYGPSTNFEINSYIPNSIEGQSKFVEQLHNSLVELRRSGDTNIIIHTRMQDTIRIRLVLKELYKQGKIYKDVKTKVVSHVWELDKGDTKGSLAFSFVKYWKLDLPTVRRLPNYDNVNL